MSFAFYDFYLFVIFSFLGSIIGGIVLRRNHINDSVLIKSIKYFLNVVFDLAFALGVKHHLIKVLSDVIHSRLSLYIVLSAVSLVFGFVIVAVVAILLNMHKYLGHYADRYNAIGVGTFLYLIVSVLVNLKDEINPWGALWYATDYSMGMGSRFLIGTVLRLINNDYVYLGTAVLFCYVFVIAVVVMISLLVNRMYSQCEDKCKPAFAFIWILYLVSPGSIVCFWQSPNVFGRLEFYCMFLSLVCLLIYSRFGMNVATSIIYTLLSCLSIAIYQGGIFMFYSLILMLFVWEVYKNVHQIRVWVYCLTNLLTTSICFIIFQFFSFTRFDDVDQMIVYMSDRTDVPIVRSALDRELFQPFLSSFAESANNYMKAAMPRESSVITLVLLAPIFIMFIGIYIKCFNVDKIRNTTGIRSIHLYFLLFLFFIVPQFFLNVDWGRWIISETMILFIPLLFLVWKREEGAFAASVSLSNWIGNHKVLSAFVLVYIASFDRFDHYYFIVQTNNVLKWLLNNNFLVPPV